MYFLPESLLSKQTILQPLEILLHTKLLWKVHKSVQSKESNRIVTLAMLNELLLLSSQSDYIIKVANTNSLTEWQTMQVQISWLLKKPLIWINTVCKGRAYPGSAGQGLINITSCFLGILQVKKKKVLNQAVTLKSLTLVLLNPDIPCLCKQCRSRSVGFWRSQLIWICTVCH